MSMSPTPLNPPRFRCLLGTTPGLLDPTQPARVLRGLGWRLSFVALEDMTDPTCAEADGMRRIVIDEPPMGAGAPQCRLIPNAELGPGVANEGKSWPRIVNLCGEFVVCSREQWYIYKLDPAYHCYVPLHPHPPIIRRKEPDPRNDNGKREVPDTAEDLERLTKRFRTALSFDDTGLAKVAPPSDYESGPQVDVEGADLPMEDASTDSQPSMNMTPNTSDAAPPRESPTVVENYDNVPGALQDHTPSSKTNGPDTDTDVTMRGTTPSPATDPDTTAFASTGEGTSVISAASPPYSGNVHGETGTSSQGNARRSDELPAEPQPSDTQHAGQSMAGPGLAESATQPSSGVDEHFLASSARPEVIDIEMEVEDQSYPQQYRAKRKDREPDEASGEQHQPPVPKDLENEHSPKRRRTMDPATPSKESIRAAKRKALRRSERVTNKKLREEAIQEDRRRREEEFWREMLKSEDPEPSATANAHPSSYTPHVSPPTGPRGSSSSGSSGSSGSSSSGSLSSSPPETQEDAEHRAAIQESRRKIAELEKDKPVWVEHQNRRVVEEARIATEAPALHQRRIAEEKRRAAEQERKQAEEAEAKRASARRARELKRRGEEERRRLAERYSRRLWTIEAAIRYYVTAAKVFDNGNFTPENPLLFETIPWPTLVQPWLVKAGDITWEAVEQFFKEAYGKLLHSAYKELVDQTHKRFHPDRWCGRKMVKSVGHEELADRLVGSANLVAQAVTPIWKQSRGK